jgi:hypothetical protein
VKKERRKCTRDGKTKKKTTQLLDDLEEKRRYWKLKKKSGWHSLENSLWRRLRTCHKADYVMMQWQTNVGKFASRCQNKFHKF